MSNLYNDLIQTPRGQKIILFSVIAAIVIGGGLFVFRDFYAPNGIVGTERFDISISDAELQDIMDNIPKEIAEKIESSAILKTFLQRNRRLDANEDKITKQITIEGKTTRASLDAEIQNSWPGYGYDPGSTFTTPNNLASPLTKVWEYEFLPEMPEIKQYWIHNVIAANNTILVPAAAWHKGKEGWVNWNYGAGTPSITGLNAQTGARIWHHAPAQTDAGYKTWWLAADIQKDRFWQNDDGETGYYTGTLTGTESQSINWPNVIFQQEKYSSYADIWGAIKIIDSNKTIVSSVCIQADCPGLGISMRTGKNTGWNKDEEIWHYAAVAKQCPMRTNCDITGNVADYNTSLAIDLGTKIILWTPNILSPQNINLPEVAKGKSGIYAFNVNQPNIQGQYLWFIPGNFISAVSTANSEVFVVSKDDDNQNRLKKLDINSGSLLWQSNPLPSLVGFQAPAIYNNKVYVIANDYLYAFNVTTGALVWQSVNIPDSVARGGPETRGGGGGGGALETTFAISAPTNSIYITGNKKVYAIDAENGQIKWQSGDLIVNSTLRNPVIAYGNLYVVQQPWGDNGQSGDPSKGSGGKVIALQGQQVTPLSAGTISASPNPCSVVSPAATCSSAITWQTTNAPSACVFVKETKQLFNCAVSGNQTASGITEEGSTFEVHLNNDIDSQLLSSVLVNGQKETPPPPPPPPPPPTSTCSTGPLQACIDSLSPNPVKQGQTITFTGSGKANDPSKTITKYRWRLDSVTGTTRICKVEESTVCQADTSTISAGVHTVYFRVGTPKYLIATEWSNWIGMQFSVEGTATPVFCGNNVCESGESTASCPNDCPAPPPPPSTIPSAPSNLFLKQHLSGPNNYLIAITASWKDNSNNETKFELERRKSSSDPWVKRADVKANSVYYYDNTVNGQSYSYRVRACNASGCSGWAEK